MISVAAQRLESRAEGHLRPFADQADRRAISTLEGPLSNDAPLEAVPPLIQKRVLSTASADFATLWPAVRDDAEARAHEAAPKLQARGEDEARALRRIIEAQRTRIPGAGLAENRPFLGLAPGHRAGGLLDRSAAVAKLSEEAFSRVWDNPDDAEYDKL